MKRNNGNNGGVRARKGASSVQPKILLQDEHMTIESSKGGRAIIVHFRDSEIATTELVDYDGKLLLDFLRSHQKELQDSAVVIIDFKRDKKHGYLHKDQFINSSLVTELEKAIGMLQAQNVTVMAAGVAPNTLAEFQITGLSKRLGDDNIHATLESALQTLTPLRLHEVMANHRPADDKRGKPPQSPPMRY